MPSDLSNDEINFIITRLALPDPSIRVATECSNQNSMGEVQAYAKLAGSSWTYYVRSLSVVIGRKASPDLNPDGDDIQIDLGPSKVVSRKHAVIQYNGNYWTITVHGRNGVKIDKANHKEGSSRLFSGNIIDIGGVQMMFVLPDAKPRVAQAFRKYWLLNNLTILPIVTNTQHNLFLFGLQAWGHLIHLLHPRIIMKITQITIIRDCHIHPVPRSLNLINILYITHLKLPHFLQTIHQIPFLLLLKRYLLPLIQIH